jgi:hypothetical protein
VSGQFNALVAEKVMSWRVCDRTDVQDGTLWQTQWAPALVTAAKELELAPRWAQIPKWTAEVIVELA